MTGDELIYVEPRQDAVLQCDGITVACRSVPEAWLYWAQLERGEKERATIEVGDSVYDVWAIRRLRYGPAADDQIADAA